MGIVVLIFIFYSMFSISSSVENEFLSKEQTMQINGVFILIVFLSHFRSYIDLTTLIDYPAVKICKLFGQLMVTSFLMFSGYGCACSWQKYKNKYIQNFAVHRILSTLLKFDVAVFCFVLVNVIMGNDLDVTQIVLALTGWISIGNSNWYIFSIIVMYVTFYISCRLFQNECKRAFIIQGLFSFVYMILMLIFKEELVWIDTILCFNFGIWISLYKNRVVQWCENKKRYRLTLCVCLILFILMYPRRYYFSVFSMNLVSIIFCSIINLLSYRISFHSKIYTWMGKHLFEMYMYQRIPMWLLKYTVIYQNKYMYFVLSLLSTVLIAYVMHKINSKIDQKLNTLVRT